MPDPNPRQALATLLTRLAATPRSARPAVIRLVLPLLADGRLSAAIRIAAAARVLRFVPDRASPVRRVVRAMTMGLSPSRALDRLRQLQHQVERCETLDVLIDARERRVKLACPRCRVRLPRVEMIEHLWHEHRLTLHRGKTRPLARIVEELQDQHAATGDLVPLDRVAGLVGPAGLRRWLAHDDPPAEEVAPLLVEAAKDGTGLCPSCFAGLPVAVTALPPPLDLASGRLAGDEFAVAIGENHWFRSLAITTLDRQTSVGSRSLTPRGAATLAAALVLLVTATFAWSLALAWAGLLLALGTYVGVRFTQSPAGRRDDRVFDVAWSQLAPRLSERSNAARFLTRLCLASHDHGDPLVRTRVLGEIAARAWGRSEESDVELQLLAASRVLQVEDEARHGRDGVAGIASLAAEGFTGPLPADFAEYVVGCYLTHERDPGDLARLRVLLLASAFEAGLVPRDMLDLWAGAPNLKRAMAVEPAHRLGLLFGLWRTRTAQAWQVVGPADTVFELARTSPPTAARVLARFPDLLLFHRPQRHVEDAIGPLLVCGRGVAIGGHLVADPDAEVRLTPNGRELLYGRYRIELARKLPTDFIDVVRRWLRFRAEGLLPFIDGYLAPGSDEVRQRVLGPFCRKCLTCGTTSAVSAGAIGRPVGA